MGVEPAVRPSARVVDEAALHHDRLASPSDLDGAVHVDAVAACRLADLVAAPEHVEARRAHASPPRDVAVPHTHARTLLDGHHVPRAGAADREVVEEHVGRALNLEAELLLGTVVDHHAGLGRIAHPAVRLAAVAHLHGEGRIRVEPHGARYGHLARPCAERGLRADGAVRHYPHLVCGVLLQTQDRAAVVARLVEMRELAKRLPRRRAELAPLEREAGHVLRRPVAHAARGERGPHAQHALRHGGDERLPLRRPLGFRQVLPLRRRCAKHRRNEYGRQNEQHAGRARAPRAPQFHEHLHFNTSLSSSTTDRSVSKHGESYTGTIL